MRSSRKILFLTALVFFSPLSSFAKGLSLTKLHPNALEVKLTGYDVLLDQIFEIDGGVFKNEAFFFTDVDPKSKLPRFHVSKGDELTDSQTLPGIDTGWRLQSVEAVALDEKHSTRKTAQILAILRFEPPSGSKDGWDQAMVFEVNSNGKISIDAKLNKKLLDTVETGRAKDQVRTISQLKKLLDES